MLRIKMANPRGMPNTWKDFPTRKDAEGHDLCRRCRTVLSGRKTSWCGKECLKIVLLLVHWPRMRQFILRRDKRKCQVCGLQGKEVDHIIEVQDGGLSVAENLRTLCHSCHVKKTTEMKRKRAAEKRRLLTTS